MTETADTTFGRLMESTHLAGYGLQRAWTELESLLEENRFQELSRGYADVNEFMAAAKGLFASLNIDPAGRKRIAQRVKELQPEASQRAIAGVLGVDQKTVQRDLVEAIASNTIAPQASREITAEENASNTAPSTNVESSVPSQPSIEHPTSTNVEPVDDEPSPVPEPSTSSPNPWTADPDLDPARLLQGRSERKQRDAETERRHVQEARAQTVAIEGGVRCELRAGDFRAVLADLSGVDAIITDPPYGHDFLPLLTDLAAWADQVLEPEGVLAVLFGQTYLPEAYERLAGHRRYRWTCCYLTEGAGYVSHQARAQANWKPVLLYGGTARRISDLIRSEGEAGERDRHPWEQSYSAFAHLVRQLTEPGQLVVDPFAGSGTTLAAARDLGRHSIGAELEAAHVATARERLGI